MNSEGISSERKRKEKTKKNNTSKKQKKIAGSVLLGLFICSYVMVWCNTAHAPNTSSNSLMLSPVINPKGPENIMYCDGVRGDFYGRHTAQHQVQKR